MKAMKKVLFLTLVMALALTAVAFADTTVQLKTITSPDKIMTIVNALDAHKNEEYCAETCGVVAATDGEVKNVTYVKGDCVTAWSFSYECTKCNTIYKGATTVDPNAKHNFVKTQVSATATDATCSADATGTWVLTCSCGATAGNTEGPKAYGHKLVEAAYDHADVKYVVGEAMTAQQATNLAWVINNCATDWGFLVGNTAAQENVGHVKAEIKNAGSCSKVPTLVITCDECVKGKVTTIKTFELASAQHDFTGATPINVVDATCEENGYKEYKCNNCTFIKREIIEAKGHEYHWAIKQDGKIVAISSKKIEEYAGITTLTEWVNAKLSEEKFDLCKPYSIIKICRADLTKTEKDAAGDHITTTYKCNDMVLLEDKAAAWSHEITKENYKNLEAAGRIKVLKSVTGNCTNEGYVVVKCEHCDYTAKIVTREIGHAWKAIDDATSVVKKAATCTETGIMVVQCTNYANCKTTTEKTIEKKAHVEIVTIQDATDCTKTGTKTYTCKVCLQPTKAVEIIPAGHKFTGATTKVNINADGKIIDCTKVATETGKCVRCNTENVTNTYPANTAHTKPTKLVEKVAGKGNMVTVKSTCQTAGTVTYDCAKCATGTIVEVLPVAAHFANASVIVKGEITKAPTCTATGTQLEYCSSTCTESREAVVPMAAHSYVYKNNKLVCSVCGATEDMVDTHDFKVNTNGITMTSTSTSGTGKITTKDNSGLVNHNEKLYARINFGYKLDNGEAVAYVTCVPVDAEGEFRMASPTAPYGATLTNVTVMITTAAQAQDMLIADVPNCGVTVLR